MSQIDRAQLAGLLERAARDIRRGRPSFVALAVITPSAEDPAKPVVAVAQFRDPGDGMVSAAFSMLATEAQEIGALVPD